MKKNLEQEQSMISKVWNILENIIYYIILIPLVIVTLMIVYQQIVFPDKIPDIFGWKIFIIMDEYMDDSVRYADLVFTKNIEPENLKVNDVIAFRNATNTVTIHKILEIDEEEKIDETTQEERLVRSFKMKTLKNETSDTKVVNDSKVEGILKHKIPKVGLIILLMQEPLVLVVILCVILIIGLIALYIAQRLDEKDKRLEELNKKEENKSSE